MYACPWWSSCNLYRCGGAIVSRCPGEKLPSLIIDGCDWFYDGLDIVSSVRGALGVLVNSVLGNMSTVFVFRHGTGGWFPRARGCRVEELPRGLLARCPSGFLVFVLGERVPFSAIHRSVFRNYSVVEVAEVIEPPPSGPRYGEVVKMDKGRSYLELVVELGEHVCGGLVEQPSPGDAEKLREYMKRL